MQENNPQLKYFLFSLHNTIDFKINIFEFSPRVKSMHKIEPYTNVLTASLIIQKCLTPRFNFKQSNKLYFDFNYKITLALNT